MKKRIARIVKTIFKPAKLAHYKLSRTEGIIVRDNISAVLCVGIFLTVAVRCYPYGGLGDIGKAALIAAALSAAGVLVFVFAFPYLKKLASGLCLLPAWLYDMADDSVNDASRRKRGGASPLQAGKKAEVGIRYFIEREKRIKCNHAKYLGRN